MKNKTVTFVNGVKDADVWILPETKENLRTTVWGKATLPKVKTGESREILIPEPGDNGCYILRMIDTDSFFYSADGIELEEGWTLQIKENDDITAEVTDENGTLKKSYKVFYARL